MKFFQAVTVIFLSFILVSSLTSLVIGLSFSNLLKEQTYQKALEETDGYNEISSMFDESLEGIKIEEDDLKFLVNKIINEFLPYLRGDTDNPDLTLNLTPYIKSFYLEEIKKIPDCAGLRRIEICRPPFLSDEEFLQLALASEGTNLNEIGEINLIEFIGEEETIANIREGIQTYYKVLIGLAFLALISGILIFVVTRRSRTASEIIDIDLFVVAFTMFGISYYVNSNILHLTDFEIPLKNTFLNIFQQLLQLMTAYGAIIMALGMILTAIGLVLAIKYRSAVETKVTELVKKVKKKPKKKKKNGKQTQNKLLDNKQ